nr:zinc finger, CCHC-type [Tanacetum cinerariifolium]
MEGGDDGRGRLAQIIGVIYPMLLAFLPGVNGIKNMAASLMEEVNVYTLRLKVLPLSSVAGSIQTNTTRLHSSTFEPADNAQLDIKKDMAATTYLYQALPEDMILQVASCNSAKEISEALQTRHIGVDRMQKARLQTLKTKFEMLKIKEDDSIDEFSAKLNSIIVAAIEQFTDLEETTLDETIGRLKTFEERVNLFNGSPSDNQDTLLFSNHDNSLSHEKGFKNGGQEKFRDKDEKIFLNEKEIKPKKYISTDESLWYLDNRAINHMTGIRTHFKVVEKISGRVRFGDGSYVKIKGQTEEVNSHQGNSHVTAEAIRHAVYVLNRVPTKALKDSTPYEALKDRKPNMRHLRVFGCKAYEKDKLMFSNHDNSSSHEKGFKNSGQEKFRSYQDNKQDGKTKQFNNEKKPSHKFKRNNFQKDNVQLDIKKDMAATACLYQALPEDMILHVASCNSAKEISEALQTRHIGVDRV